MYELSGSLNLNHPPPISLPVTAGGRPERLRSVQSNFGNFPANGQSICMVGKNNHSRTAIGMTQSKTAGEIPSGTPMPEGVFHLTQVL
jgi:hypothetical protein